MVSNADTEMDGTSDTIVVDVGEVEEVEEADESAGDDPDPAGPSTTQVPGSGGQNATPTPVTLTQAERTYVPLAFPATFQNYDMWLNTPTRVQQEFLAKIVEGELPQGPGPNDTDDPKDHHDPTRPHSQIYWVRRLFDAIVNITGHVDKRRKINKGESAAQPAQPVLMIIEKKRYTAEEIEVVCWDLFGKCQTRQLGITLIEAHQGDQKEHHASFADRMEAVVQVCQLHKTICKMLLDVEYGNRLVNAPIYEATRKVTNSLLNETRGIQVKAGIEAMASGNEQDQGDPELADEAFMPSIPQPLDDEATFKRRICNILAVSEELAECFSLDQLRTYAYAYNNDVADPVWKVAEFKNEHGNRYIWYHDAGPAVKSGHFALELTEYWVIANARNDILPDGLPNKQTPHINGFSVEGVAAYEQALGMIENPFGLFVLGIGFEA